MENNFSDIQFLDWLIGNNKTILLLKKDHAPLVISFLHYSYKDKSRDSYTMSELSTLLSDRLYSLNQDYPDSYTQPAKYYLEMWAKDGILRHYYESQTEESLFELTPAAENAFRWLKELNKQEFVVAGSRLLYLFNALKDLVIKTSEDIPERVARLKKQRAELDIEIAEVEAGNIKRIESQEIKEKYRLVEEIVDKLSSDFRKIEENFRDLNKQAREEQIKLDLAKGKYLEHVFHAQDLIWETPQGKSFQAFWEFLMNQTHQKELEELIAHVVALPELKHEESSKQLRSLKVNLVEAGDRVNKTNDLLIEQLRRFLDSRIYAENRKISETISAIEKIAIDIKNQFQPERSFIEIEDKPSLSFPMDRPPFEPPQNPIINSSRPEEGKEEIIDNSIYEQIYVNPEVLRDRINRALRQKPQVSLKEILNEYPIEKGMSEIITYIDIASKLVEEQKALIDNSIIEKIEYFARERQINVNLPQTIFIR